MDYLTLFGLFAVTAMLVCYAFEDRSHWFVLAFAGACVLGSAYGFLQGAWPFGIVEAIWASSIPPDWRMKAAQAALPFVHSKPARSPAIDPAITAKQIEGLSEEEARARDRILELTWRRCFDGLSDAEAEELESLEKAYPSNHDDYPLKDAFEALGRDS
jgi:hypothetical protein